jgi:tetratricopeptide (TPR) repeat protein
MARYILISPDPTRPRFVRRGFNSVSAFIEQEVGGFLTGYHRSPQLDQLRHIEVLGEKNTLMQILKPVCSDYYVPLTLGRGYASIPVWRDMATRYQQSEKDAFTLIVASDYDPEGFDLADDAVRSLRDCFSIDNIDYHRIAATQEQIEELGLEADFNPAKETSSRLQSFIDRTGGTETWELEALPPTYLQEQLRAAIVNEALTNFERSVAMERLRIDSPSNDQEDVHDYLFQSSQLGAYQRSAGQTEEAIETYEEAWKRFVELHEEQAWLGIVPGVDGRTITTVHTGSPAESSGVLVGADVVREHRDLDYQSVCLNIETAVNRMVTIRTSRENSGETSAEASLKSVLRAGLLARVTAAATESAGDVKQRVMFAYRLNRIGLGLFALNDLQCACQCYDAILEMYHDDAGNTLTGDLTEDFDVDMIAHAHGNLGWADLLQKDFAKSRERSLKALEVDPSQDWIHQNLALAHLLDGQFEEAKNIYLKLQAEAEDPVEFAEGVSTEYADVREHDLSHPDMARMEELLTAAAKGQ